MQFNGNTPTVFASFKNADVGQGRSAKYNFTSAGWKRVLNIIRASNGTVTMGIAQAYPARKCQTAAIDFGGFVIFEQTEMPDQKPVLYQRYNNIFGTAAGIANPAKITAVRIGYPKERTTYPNKDADDAQNYVANPVNCYLDVYVDMVEKIQVEGEDTPRIMKPSFNMNYSGFADSHNCVPITEETDAADVGMYGEELQYYTLTLKENAGFYMPQSDIEAGRVEADTLKAATASITNMPMYIKVSGASKVININNAVRTNAEAGKYGFWLNGTGNALLIAAATEDDIDAGKSTYKPIVPATLQYAIDKYTAERFQELEDKICVIEDYLFGE